MHNQKKKRFVFCQRHCHTSASGFIVNEPCCCSIESWACWANWAFCNCWVWFFIYCFHSFSSSFRNSSSISDFSAEKFMIQLVLLRVFFSDSALRFLVLLKVSRDFFLIYCVLIRSSSCFAFFSSDSLFLSESVSSNHWIKWVDTTPFLFLTPYFLHIFTSKVYLSLTDLVVTLKFISYREFISFQNCPRSTLPCRLLHGSYV